MEFKIWFEQVKQNAVDDFGFTTNEVDNFNEKNWIPLWEKSFTPFESIVEQLRKKFKYQNG